MGRTGEKAAASHLVQGPFIARLQQCFLPELQCNGCRFEIYGGGPCDLITPAGELSTHQLGETLPFLRILTLKASNMTTGLFAHVQKA
jgi:hypothetical protein